MKLNKFLFINHKLIFDPVY